MLEARSCRAPGIHCCSPSTSPGLLLPPFLSPSAQRMLLLLKGPRVPRVPISPHCPSLIPVNFMLDMAFSSSTSKSPDFPPICVSSDATSASRLLMLIPGFQTPESHLVSVTASTSFTKGFPAACTLIGPVLNSVSDNPSLSPPGLLLLSVTFLKHIIFSLSAWLPMTAGWILIINTPEII